MPSFKAQVIVAGTDESKWRDCYPRFRLGLDACQYAVALFAQDMAIADFRVVEDERHATHSWDGERAVKLTVNPVLAKEPSDVAF